MEGLFGHSVEGPEERETYSHGNVWYTEDAGRRASVDLTAQSKNSQQHNGSKMAPPAERIADSSGPCDAYGRGKLLTGVFPSGSELLRRDLLMALGSRLSFH